MEIDYNTVAFAFGLTLFAGLSTGIGSAIAFFAKRTNTKFLSLSLGFSAGVMIYVSFVEILQKAKVALVGAHGEVNGTIYTVLSFFGGILLIGIIDKLIPSYENPHEVKKIEDLDEKKAKDKKLMRMGMFSALAIGIHNFPEGLATFAAALTDPTIAIPIAVAIAIHNIPEGIAVSVPIFYATGSRKKAFVYSFLSGLAEPIGALIGFALIYSFLGLNDTIFGTLFGGVAGIMVFISLDELLPTAEEYGEHHIAIYGLIGGMAVMAASLLLFL
ncbi:zinc transporter ZupT [Ancylomarina sp. 16SWW S1-10-2]|uniref:zinc transporter ZupT n=1 Tax=Ancylomarina sp. 16SWW S1-10-2 TaxID=2499681 RepID=UPI0012AD5BD3|nr:zinc transporter ZupT [Ancylomarina sp. 16SWW S1-10-2]MRT93280.1 zinc transporter ZupT [Ancylomarina sp. 16SWW S1-10-2]